MCNGGRFVDREGASQTRLLTAGYHTAQCLDFRFEKTPSNLRFIWYQKSGHGKFSFPLPACNRRNRLVRVEHQARYLS